MPRNKCHLGGMDWFLCALDRRTRALTGAGNDSQVVLALDGAVSEERLRERLLAFVRCNPVLAGRSRRDPLTLAPYWDIPRVPWNGALPIERLPEEDVPCGDGPLPPAIADAVNRPAMPGRLRIAFILAGGRGRSFLAMRFDHRLLDAGGAERLLRLLGDESVTPAPLPLGDRGIHLDRWRVKFRAGKTVNRLLLGLRGAHPPAALPVPRQSGGVPLRSRFVFRSLPPERARQVIGQAERRVGYLLLLPYLLGAAARVFGELFHCRGLLPPDGHCVVPVSLDARRAAQRDLVFFNHLSFHFYRFNASALEDPAALWRQAATQFYRQTSDRIAEQVELAGSLMRIVPAACLGRLAGVPLSGRLGSFSLSLLGEDTFGGRSFLGVPVRNLHHLPRVPTPPGLGLFFTRHGGGLNLVISFLEGMLEDPEAEERADALIALLETGG